MKKKITLISGAGRGIGLEIVNEFAKNNHDLILLIRKKEQVNYLKKIEKKFNSKIKIFIGDLKNRKFLKKLNNQINYVDNLINNASGENQKYFSKVTLKDIDDLIDLNIKSTFILTQMFAIKMIKKKIKGNIVSLSSQLGHIGAYNRSIYCMAKFGLEGLNKALAMDLGKHGIRVNTVSPTKTVVNKKEYKNRRRLNIIKAKIPLNKFSEKSEIASIVYFLTTKAAGSITGTSIISDGGWTSGK